MERALDFKLDDPAIKSQFCHLLVVSLWATDFTSLCFSFLICKIGCCKDITNFQNAVDLNNKSKLLLL